MLQRNPVATWAARAAVFASLGVCVGCSDLEVRRAVAWLGDPAAQCLVGEMYAMGEGAPLDEAEAARWFRRAAERGYRKAQLSLGFLYADGNGVERDPEAALRWLTAAAEAGSHIAEARLGEMYLTGRGVPRDEGLAIEWLRKAAISVPQAQTNLGFLYASRAAASAGEATAASYLAESLRLFETAALQGYSEGQYSLGMLHLEDFDPRLDDATGRYWLRRAAAQGHERAAHALASLPR